MSGFVTGPLRLGPGRRTKLGFQLCWFYDQELPIFDQW